MTTHTPTAQNAFVIRAPRTLELADNRPAETSRSVQAATVRVLVAFDGSPAGNDALALSALLARSPGSELLVACAFPPESLASIPFEPRATRIANGDHRIFVRQDADAVLAEARATLPVGLAVTFLPLRCESAVRGLRELALSETADVLVLGSTHRGRLGRLLHPSLVRALLRDPPCAVTVVSRDSRDRPRSVPAEPESSSYGRQWGDRPLTRSNPGPSERRDLIHGHPPQTPA
ncbi:MAG: universal stress protein [Actinomycetota bacterium]|nr:universal stress protein [Actinomycetota bacterium]